jgi:uncharacterized protein (TIGR01777 family)
MKILVSGGTGFLGSNLIEELLRQNHEVLLITRQTAEQLSPTPCRIINWPPTEIEKSAILECDAAYNLAGESIAGPRWSRERKEEIRNSRIQFTRELVEILARSTKLKTFLSSSAIGIYGDRKSEVLTEESPRGEGFLADICQDWEAEALPLERAGIRLVLLRTGIVLDRLFGVLGELEPLYRLGAGGPVGSGEQFMSWIHIRDWVRAAVHALNTPSLKGALNLVAPEPVTNRSFSAVYGELFKCPVQLPAPAIALKLALGEQSTLVLASQNVRPTKLLSSHFGFQFQILKDALLDLYDYEERGREVFDLHRQTQWVPYPIDQVFRFFSDEMNLERITPPSLNFHVLKKSTEQIQKGTLIDYKLKIHGVPVKWRTLIADWQPPKQFVDTQLWGPYSLWHHTHTFESLAGGTLMKDKVHYKLPMGGLGRTAALWYVKKDVAHIFEHRKKIIRESGPSFFEK